MNRNSLVSVFGRTFKAGIACIFLAASLRAQPPATPVRPAAPLLSADQLDDMVAPIALYPDPLLSQVLVASTYPLEVVEAQQWLQRNSSLSGAQLMDAARQQNWDPSVQALVALPDVLGRLNQDVRWTTDLGNAFLAQQSDVMSAVQRMRARAEANGRLYSTPQQTVTPQTQAGQTAIQIEPADPQVVYVPVYDPAYVWGPPLWGAYPPLFYSGFGFGFGPGINIGLCFGGWGGWGWGGWGGWGWGPNWFGHSIFVNHGFFNRYGFRGGFGGGFGGRGLGISAWTHDPSHRLGVAYPNSRLAGRYQAASMASRANLRPGGGARNAFGQSYGANRAYGANRGSYRSFGGSSQYGGRSAFQGGQGYRGYQGASRSYQSAGRQSFQSAPRSSGSAMNRSYGGGARSYGGGARSYGGGARSYGGGARSYGGGGGARSFGGGGGHSFGGGGGHSFGGGHGGGGHGGGRR
jgi:uncharacterized protein DUF3300